MSRKAHNTLHDRDVPRKGNVDRNITAAALRALPRGTFPARGTWIEMLTSVSEETGLPDVPRKGNVDRNEDADVDVCEDYGRSPQGERG